MYEKMGRSLLKNQDYDIHIFGQAIKEDFQEKGITLHPHFCPPKLSFNRIHTPFKILFNTLKLKPQLIIVNSIDLLILMILNKILFGTKIIYDIRENYNFNLKYQSSYLGLKKQILRAIIKLIEHTSALFYDHFFLAEKSYHKELNFIKKENTTILQNTCITPNSPPTPFRDKKAPILYSGTIAAEYGIKELINWKLQSKHSNKLIIAGFCANKKLQQWILDKTTQRTDFELVGITELVPHQKIIDLIKNSSMGIMPYQKNKSIDRCVPTKIFEYITYQLPFIISNNPEWKHITNEYQAGLNINFSNFEEIESAATKILTERKTFFTKEGKTNISWNSIEQSLLLNITNSLIN